MSYILEALRRAESERQRGQVPGLGAGPPTAMPVAPAAGGRQWAWAAAGALTLALAAGLGWVLWRPAAPSPPIVQAAPGTGPAAVAQGVAAPMATMPPVAPAPVAVAVTAASPPPVAAVAPAAPVAPVLPVVVSAPEVAAVGPGSVPAAPAAAPAAPAPSRPVEVLVPQRSVRLAELTPQQRSEWPALNVGGSVWSESAASRFVILNGQVLREGQPVLPGLVLERIEPRAALLRWRGLLVELPL